ncbi:hypothetical protein AB4274_05110 [Vibrio sp. 10N.261.55.A10]|uniref:hypothetical protein n=1 Tax=Vibrio sp. 10N.261.55.A10 TaxID=3229687 RepID=UPI00354DCFE3
MEQLKHLDTETFSDIDQVYDKSLLCLSIKQAKIYHKYWNIYEKKIKENNPENKFPPGFLPAVGHLSQVIGNTPLYKGALFNLIMGIFTGLLVAYIGHRIGW